MLRTLGKTLGGAMAVLCLASTLVMAQDHGQKMTCMQTDGKGNCVAAAGLDGKEIVVVGEHVARGDLMMCVDKGYVITCDKL